MRHIGGMNWIYKKTTYEQAQWPKKHYNTGWTLDDNGSVLHQFLVTWTISITGETITSKIWSMIFESVARTRIFAQLLILLNHSRAIVSLEKQEKNNMKNNEQVQPTVQRNSSVTQFFFPFNLMNGYVILFDEL